jgi:hypothetical protein
MKFGITILYEEFLKKHEFRKNRFSDKHIFRRGPGSSVGIATGYGLDGPGIECRWR